MTLIDRIDLNLDLLPVARPLGFALTAAHFLLRAPLWPHSSSKGSPASILRAAGSKKSRWEGRWDSPDDDKAGRGMFHWVSSPVRAVTLSICWTDADRLRILLLVLLVLSQTVMLSVLLVLAATLNAVYLFTRTRSYRMHLRTVSRPSSTASRCVPLIPSCNPFVYPAGPPFESERAQSAGSRRVCRDEWRHARVETGSQLRQVSSPFSCPDDRIDIFDLTDLF